MAKGAAASFLAFSGAPQEYRVIRKSKARVALKLRKIEFMLDKF
jgi:hypothetical protein